MTGAQGAKDAARWAVDAARDDLVALSHRIHAHPEIAFEETLASTWCAEALSAAGYEVTPGVSNLATAFSARIGRGPLEIGLCCEYDALPDVGHACGHNVIAASAVGAGLALARVADDLGLTVRVLGTPGEEGGGGKIRMLDGGAFDGLHAAMMVHPFPVELVHMPCLAVTHLEIVYTGKEAHAAAFPELGVNAADAATVAQVAIGLLRQHAHRDDQVHGIVTSGGSAPNVVPGRAAMRYLARARDLERLDEWGAKVRRCFEAGALATGASVEIREPVPAYSDFTVDEAMASSYRHNAEALGRCFAPLSEKVAAASTDMANVSRVLPAIHPTLGIGSLPWVNHQAEFAAHCVTPLADRALTDGAAALAWTAIDLATDETQRARLLRTPHLR